jgi:hypothetical protein
MMNGRAEGSYKVLYGHHLSETKISQVHLSIPRTIVVGTNRRLAYDVRARSLKGRRVQ